MRTTCKRFLAILLFVGQSFVVAHADQKGHALKEDPKRGEARIRQDLATTNWLPLNKVYNELTPSELATLRGEYQDMPEGDEPPFPADGFAPLVRQLSSMVSDARIEGEFVIHAHVDAKGKVTGVDLIKYPSVEAGKAVALVLLDTIFKPGVCAGTPCAMSFPFRLNLHLR